MPRKETKTTIRDAAGISHVYSVLEYITPDDIIDLMVEAMAMEVRSGIPYQIGAVSRAARLDFLEIRTTI